jgi:putative DNA primase/helicase
MLKRLMLIPFDRIFTKDERDPHLFERIWAEELPGILNRALAGYQRLLARGTKFKLPTAVEQATARWIQQANPLPAFIAACCQKNAQARCLMQDFYHAFQIGPKTWVTPSPRPRIPSKATCDTSVLQQRKPTKE